VQISLGIESIDIKEWLGSLNYDSLKALEAYIDKQGGMIDTNIRAYALHHKDFKALEDDILGLLISESRFRDF
jgi:hypothetical protein